METSIVDARSYRSSRSFNWATDFSPWKHHFEWGPGTGKTSFNWATDFSPWKHRPCRRPRERPKSLQLGHGFFSVETIPFPHTRSRLFPCFNWATDFSPWKQNSAEKLDCWKARLQLGHGFFSVETTYRYHARIVASQASIGPRIFLRGNEGSGDSCTLRIAASIGPRIFLRGNSKSDKIFPVNPPGLQLGHGFFSVETSATEAPLPGPGGASIGPRIFLRGNGPRLIRVSPTSSRFNWATDFSPWKPDIADEESRSVRELQLGHGFFSVETSSVRSISPVLYQASIGPRIFLRGNVHPSAFVCMKKN